MNGGSPIPPDIQKTTEADENARYPWVGWLLLVVGVLLVAGGTVRACW